MKSIAAAARPPHRVAPAIAIAIAICLSAISGPARAQTAVRDVDRPSRQPFQTVIANQVVGELPRLFALVNVPLGKRLVIEHASAQLAVPPTPTRQYLAYIWLRTEVGGERVDHVLILDRMHGLPTGNAEVFQASQPMRVYADPGTTVSALVSFHTGSRSDDVDEAIINRIGISGYFVDAK